MASIRDNAVPSHEKWTSEMRSATPEEALKLREHALLSLNQSQAWSPFVRIAEDILDERKIRFCPNPKDALAEFLKQRP